MISRRYVRKPRKVYRCAMCEGKIAGHHIYLFGGEEFVSKPCGIRVCPNCALDREKIVEEAYEFAIEHMTRVVEIPAGQQHEGFYRISVRLEWICPVCGGPRGEVYKTPSFDGSLRMIVDGWRNACGHVDYYGGVRNEAKANGLNVDSSTRKQYHEVEAER